MVDYSPLTNHESSPQHTELTEDAIAGNSKLDSIQGASRSIAGSAKKLRKWWNRNLEKSPWSTQARIPRTEECATPAKAESIASNHALTANAPSTPPKPASEPLSQISPLRLNPTRASNGESLVTKKPDVEPRSITPTRIGPIKQAQITEPFEGQIPHSQAVSDLQVVRSRRSILREEILRLNESIGQDPSCTRPSWPTWTPVYPSSTTISTSSEPTAKAIPPTQPISPGRSTSMYNRRLPSLIVELPSQTCSISRDPGNDRPQRPPIRQVVSYDSLINGRIPSPLYRKDSNLTSHQEVMDIVTELPGTPVVSVDTQSHTRNQAATPSDSFFVAELSGSDVIYKSGHGRDSQHSKTDWSRVSPTDSAVSVGLGREIALLELRERLAEATFKAMR